MSEKVGFDRCTLVRLGLVEQANDDARSYGKCGAGNLFLNLIQDAGTFITTLARRQ